MERWQALSDEERFAEHQDDSYGGCTICREYVPYTDDESFGVAFPCPVVRLAKVAEAYDLLGGMWSWSEENGYFETGNTWPLLAGRVLKEVVGRPAKPPERKLNGESS